MLRKRYTVVVVGEGGMALAQRSEVSRHRSEREARAAAEEARGRLTVMHGDRAGSYRVVIERATGFLMASERLDAVQAFDRLRQSARSSRRKIGAVAEELLRTGRLPPHR